MHSWLENIIKSKVMKNETTYQSKHNNKCTVKRETSVPGLLQNLSPNSGTCLNQINEMVWGLLYSESCGFKFIFFVIYGTYLHSQ